MLELGCYSFFNISMQLKYIALVAITGFFFITGSVQAYDKYIATGLSEAQVKAIIDLVTSFGADTATIQNVQAALEGNHTPVSQSSTSALKNVTWGRATISYPLDWNLSVTKSEDFQNELWNYSAQLSKNGGDIATLVKSPGPSVSDGDAMTYDLIASTFTTSGGISVNKYVGNCKTQSCATTAAHELIYAFGIPGSEGNYSIRVKIAAAGGYFDTREQAESTMDPIVMSLRSQLNTSKGSGVCTNFSHDFMNGATDAKTDGEVSLLQIYLRDAKVYPEALITGYFGPATSRALQNWQQKHGITITTQGIGMFGPKTRAEIARGCADGAESGW
jgi:hypothetical protein